MPVGDAVIFFNHELAKEFEYRCKQAGRLASKMRFLAAPWVGMLESGAWLKRAGHANRCARMLESGLRDIDGVELLMPTQANAVFVRLPGAVASGLRDRGWRFYSFIGSGGVRLMCSWDTTEYDVAAFLNNVRALCQCGTSASATQSHA